MNNTESNILVAIKCNTYNQEPFIRECLEGFVKQNTNFKFVAIVHDDASSDKTADIIREYEKKYPEIIKPIYETENQYSKHDGSLARIMDSAIAATGAKYVAMCEGDDYWTDSYKLQKQVDFLEKNEDYVLCFHRCRVLDQKTGTFHTESVRDMQGESTILDIAEGNYIHTPSVVYRVIYQVIEDRKNMPPDMPVGDYVLWMILAQYGKIWKFDDEMSVYRAGVGVWSGSSCSYVQSRWVVVLHYLASYFEKKNDDVEKLLLNQMTESVEMPLKDFEDQVDKLDRQLSNVRKSHSYRLGKAILAPFSWIKNKIRNK